MIEDYEKLLATTNRLKALVDDPQPGLRSWCRGFIECLTYLSQYPEREVNDDQTRKEG